MLDKRQQGMLYGLDPGYLWEHVLPYVAGLFLLEALPSPKTSWDSKGSAIGLMVGQLYYLMITFVLLF